MSYTKILKQAYFLTIHNPLLWLFGLFLASGFNLNALYAIVSNRSGIIWDSMRSAIEGHVLWLGVGSVGAVLLFLIAIYLKVWFISEAHERIHPDGLHCKLCYLRSDRESWSKRLPDFQNFLNTLIASAITIVATLVILIPLNFLIQNPNPSAGVAVAITFIATLMIVCTFACWNIFTVFLIVLHKQSFTNSSRQSIDLLFLRVKPVFEFILSLIVIYALVVIVGSFLIVISQFEFKIFPPWTGEIVPILTGGKAAAAIVFGVWLAFTNVFFNLSLLLFFDQLVKPVKKEEILPAGLPQSAL